VEEKSWVGGSCGGAETLAAVTRDQDAVERGKKVGLEEVVAKKVGLEEVVGGSCGTFQSRTTLRILRRWLDRCVMQHFYRLV